MRSCRTAGGASALLLAVLVLSAAPPSHAQTWEELEDQGAVLAGTHYRVGDVFDLEDPDEDHWLARLANFIHIDTRERVIAREILFDPSAPVDARLVRETERNLRELRYLRDARIEPLPSGDGQVDAVVITEDAWSLRAGGKFRYEGGTAEWGIDVEELNFLGLGKRLRLAYEDDRERTSAKVAYRDPRLLATRWRLALEYEDLSDGRRRLASLARPFFALGTPWAAAASVFDGEYSVRLYELGEEVERYPSRFERGSIGAWKAVSRTGEAVLRLGLEFRLETAEYEDAVVLVENDLPEPNVEPRDLTGIFARAHYLDDRFAVVENMASIGRREDINLGWEILGAAGVNATALGGSEDSFGGVLEAVRHWRPAETTTVKFSARADGRYRDGRWTDSRYGASLTLFNQDLPRQTVAVAASFAGGVDLAPERLLTLGASDGLRGYVDDYLSGDRRWVVSVEDRVITGLDFWGIARLGFVVFADAGAIRRFDTGDWSRTYADGGFGLRIGNLKSAFGRVILATVAFPLVKGEGVNDYEIFLGNEIPF